MQAGSSSEASGTPAPQWQAISSRQRRVAGVLVEKAKTVPDSYPMTLNAIITGCNQKNNRDPQMELNEEEVQQALDDLRALGAVTEVQNSGRVPKFRHHLYEWLGVDKVEIAVMAELLLRGPQSIGELRGRAARMEPIADVNALQAILKALEAKRLVIEMTPAGRGQIVAHNLFKERELVELRAEYAGLAAQAVSSGDPDERPAARVASPGFTPGVTGDMFTELKLEVAELRAEVARLRSDLQELNLRLS